MDEFKIYVNDIDKVKRWIKTHDKHLGIALRWSAKNGYLNVVHELIKAGANIHTDDDAALHCSILNGHLEIARELIKACVLHKNLLRKYVTNGNVEMVQLIMSAF